MRKNLAELQEEMRLRNLVENQVDTTIPVQLDPEQRPYCANCVMEGRKPPRLARRGSTLCSRCTYQGVQNRLRDTLPGLEKKAETVVRLQEVERKLDGKKSLQEEAEDEVFENIMYGEGTPSHELEFDGLLPESDSSRTEVIASEKVPQGNHYTRKQVAQMVGVSPTTIYKWEKKGAIPEPERFVHSNQLTYQLFYTDEIVEAIKAYKAAVISAAYNPTPRSPQEVAAKEVKKTFKMNKRLEKAVSIHIGRTGFRGAGKLM